MLETKRVVAYGKRSTRIVYVSGDTRTPHASPFAKHRVSRENTTSTSPPSARKILGRGRKVHGLSTSPRGSPKSGNILGLASKKPSDPTVRTPRRRPLSIKSTTIPASPSIVYLGQSAQTPNSKLTTFAPFVDSDVIVIEEPSREDTQLTRKVNKGRTNLSQLRQMATVEEGEAEVVRPSRRRALKRPVVVSDDEDDDNDVEATIRRPNRGARMNPIVVSDDSSDDYPDIVPSQSVRDAAVLRPTKAPNAPLGQPRPLPSRRVQVEVSIPTTQLVSLPQPSRSQGITFPPAASSRPALQRVLTRPRPPRRSQRKAPPVSQTQARQPSTSDLERSFAALSISADVDLGPEPSRPLPGPSAKKSSPQQHLAPLLGECAQTAPHCFNAFVETFPFDELHDDPSVGRAFRKIGEASFSEVFAIGDVVLKIVPLRDDSHVARQLGDDIDLPLESDAKDVLQEMIVTRAMGQICPGFIKLLRTYVVVGEYPSLLLSLWDEFNGIKSSENIRPDVFPSTQAYALLVLPNGGPDLEAYIFPMKAGWRQACSIFWQTAKTLAIAEELVSFEHRDLHWGQILVKGAVPVRKVMPRTPKRRGGANVSGASGMGDTPMDHPCHGVTATIIDLGLARMNATDGNGSDVHWTPLDDLIFEGEGDYQFDVYRMMRRVHEGGGWDRYCPLTNLMWLHYLSSKLIRSKRLRPPGTRNASTVTNEFGEKQCYDCLIEMEQLLGNSIPQLKGKKNRGAGAKTLFSKAGDVVYLARSRGWLE